MVLAVFPVAGGQVTTYTGHVADWHYNYLENN